MSNCEKCNSEMDSYYGPWCPRCDKPEFKMIPSLNLIKALTHIQAITGDKEYKERMMDNFCEWHGFSNDSSISFHPDFQDETPDFKLLVDTFNIKQEILLEVSW